MSWRDWIGGPGSHAALGALAVAVVVLAWAVVGSFAPADVPDEPESPSVVQSPLDGPPPVPRVDVTAAVARDPFSPARTAPPVRYRPPDEVLAGTRGAPQEPTRPVVLGTAIAADGSSFATCQFGSPKLLMVRVGDHVGSYIVASIGRGRVVFRTPAGKPYEVLVPRPGS